jgi:hypothetical protein
VRQEEPWQVIDGVEFRSHGTGQKASRGECWEHQLAVIYKGQ